MALAGYRSFAAFWIGGAEAPVPPPPPPTPPGGIVQFSQITDLKRQPVWGVPITEGHVRRMVELEVTRELEAQIKREDDDILAIIAVILKCY